MPRVKLNFPEDILFKTEISIRISDINYGNHLGNDRVLSLAHEARLHWFSSMGFKDELDFPDHTGTIITDAEIMFLGEGFYADVLEVSIGMDAQHSKGFELYYSMVRKSDKKEIARLKTGILFFNYSERKVVQIPSVFLERLSDSSQT